MQVFTFSKCLFSFFPQLGIMEKQYWKVKAMHIFMPGEDRGSLLQMVQKYCLLLLSLIAQLPDTNFVSYHTRYYAS